MKSMKKKKKPKPERSASSVPAAFDPHALDASKAAAARAAFKSAKPYTHVHLYGLFEQESLLAVRRELGTLHRTFKETDLFKLYQSGDLANLSADIPEHAAALPAMIQLRAALYSEPFRAFVRSVTGCAPLTAQQDCSCNMYRKGGHLLCHDDVIGTRCVSYIVYLSRPGKSWKPRLGGALELYELGPDGATVEPSPVSALPPEFGSMVMFTVQPGVSYHAVQEVQANEPRLSVSGWFHAATPPAGADSAASLAQLQHQGRHDQGARPRAVRPPRPRPGLSSAQEQRLALLVSPVYLRAGTIAAVRAQLEAQGAALLTDFLRPEIAHVLRRATAAADTKDGLGGGTLPPHLAGQRRKGWRAVGPPQLRRYLRHTPPKRAAAAEEGGKAGGKVGVGARLQAVRALMHSAPFVQLLSALSGHSASRCASEVRRFRPGLDYTLAHVGTLRAQSSLEATLSFVADEPHAAAQWDSGDVGGFECYVPSSDEGAAEVYRADEDSEGVTSVHPIANALSLVVRRPNVMKFVKYVSAAAAGSRWDVAAEYLGEP